MTENRTELLKRLVVGHKRDGRSRYDPEAKRELIEACLRPGVSVARMALQHGVNANLLRTWMTRHRRQHEPVGRPALAMAATSVGSAFVPVVATSTPVRTEYRLRATLRNGVEVDFGMTGDAELPTLLQLLDRLPCSTSTRG